MNVNFAGACIHTHTHTHVHAYIVLHYQTIQHFSISISG